MTLKPLKRRKLLSLGGSLLMAAPFMSLTACGSSSSSGNRSSDSGLPDSGTDTDLSATSDWASGGTDLITADFPDTSIFSSSGSCSLSLTQNLTVGPCYIGVNEREDISEGESGLPMQFCMQLVDEDCNPLAGYLIEIWHCDTRGLYSGDTSDEDVDDTSTWAGGFCTSNNSEAVASTWFRGEQTTDADGRVNFKTCFPGWYRGRTIHIHFRVRNGSGDYVVSQFCFSDSFAREICTTHELYRSRGEQDRTLASGRDSVFPAEGYEEFMLNIEQNEDGTLLAYKRAVISV
ncbi:MAG: intradiol ring-cleavage dioxygenase [Oceanospirillaceae bacterium]|uniref:dioxygenase family protein n=1 Tax=unclassified Thalassolituus TaxID=2624967 RepID=UPI000C090AAA|nr:MULTISPECIES: intradiol ring-cleavage dioxygenase [unclassified Thalassolituus]MAK89696.1 intradiol ring-cleavage dioxygenase [Thalassolituus sp.]MAS25376.1 intradiol ring-cleavage dioxygenase [Oceanospirillaceae bacterium]MAY00480.1 intradiol ring-cleavage dioxygenase [Oceanospirillaceae bacterium]MBL34498.1 intradiol ring-cleavage dioxygenase [Oceanospirillaceae bacterium]MBS52640.1 intradiol ring-cleavage dioxygenase [Oceanospirillaceae bacterium]|tara:strand:+ start:478 stop:1347 length:870 start_codon:yes stop_codon:yes gene_type:complete